MEATRYALGVFVIVILPTVIAFWAIMHSGRALWRSRGPRSAYLCAGLGVVFTAATCWLFRDVLMGRDLGGNPWILVPGVLIYLGSWLLWWPVKKELDFKTFTGAREVVGEEGAGRLIQSGIYAMVRHPRYLMVTVGTFGWALFVNHLGVYLICGLSIAGLMMIVRLEETELVERFGEAYIHYKKQVPALIPTPASFRTYWSGSKTISG